MPMSTMLFAVTQSALDGLLADPLTIHDLTPEATYSTYLQMTLSYFLTEDEDDDEDDEDDEDEDDEDDDEEDDEDDEDGEDDADDDEEPHPLDAALNGTTSIACARLELGAFSVVSVDEVALVSRALATVKPAEVRRRVLDAELEELLDGELTEELEQCDLSEPDEVASKLSTDLAALVKFYAAAAKHGHAVVMYTT